MNLEETAVEIGLGAAAGIATGLKSAAAPHVHCLIGPPAAGAFFPTSVGSKFNHTAKATNAATKSFQHHHKIGTALAAGTTAVLGHGVLGTVVVAVAPVAAIAAVAGGAVFGIFKLVEYLREA